MALSGGSAAGLLGGPTARAAAGEDLVRQWKQAALNSITDASVPPIRRTPPVAARSLAIAHAAYQALTALFGARAEFGALLAAQVSAPDDPAPAAQVGRQAATDIL